MVRENQTNRTNELIQFVNIDHVLCPETNRMNNTMNRVSSSQLGGQIAGSCAMDFTVKPYPVTGNSR